MSDKRAKNDAEKDYFKDIESFVAMLPPVLHRAAERALGENYFIPYGKGTEGAAHNSLLGDTWYKDASMVVLQPIALAIDAALSVAAGFIGMALNLLPALVSSKAREEFTQAMTCTLIGVGFALLAAIAPVARTYNMATRLYASATHTEAPEPMDMNTITEEKLNAVTRDLNIEDLNINPDAFSTLYKSRLSNSTSEDDSDIDSEYSDDENPNAHHPG